MTNVNAAMGVAQLEKIKIFLKAKKEIFSKYSRTLNKIEGIDIFKEPKSCKSNYWLQTLVLSKKNSKFKNLILKKLHKSKIYARPSWKLISELKPYKNCKKMNLGGSREIYKRIINLPSSQGLILKRR